MLMLIGWNSQTWANLSPRSNIALHTSIYILYIGSLILYATNDTHFTIILVYRLDVEFNLPCEFGPLCQSRILDSNIQLKYFFDLLKNIRYHIFFKSR